MIERIEQLARPDQCANCPDRGFVSKSVAKLVLGKNYTVEGCEGASRKTNPVSGISLDGGRSFAGLEVYYVCGGGNEATEQKTNLADTAPLETIAD